MMRKYAFIKVIPLLLLMGAPNVSCSPNYSSLMNLLGNAGDLGTITNLIDAAGGMGNLLGGLKNFTMLAPSDDAFGALGQGALETLMGADNKDQLTGILQNHILPGKLGVDDLLGMGSSIASAGGMDIGIEDTGDGLKIGGANVLETLNSKNGIIHIIDQVLQ